MATLHLMPGAQINREFREVLADSAESSVVLVPYGARPTVRLYGFVDPGRSLQYTTSPEADIWAGTAFWIDWIVGTVSGTTEARAKGAMTGVRLSGGGAGTWEIIG